MIESIKQIHFVRNLSKRMLITILWFILVIALLIIFLPKFFQWSNLINILVQASTTGLLTIGLTFVLITGGIDLSLPSIMACASVIGAIVMRDTQNIFFGLATVLLVSMLIGFLNGIAVSRLRMIPFIVTMAMMVISDGLASLFSGSKSIAGLPAAYPNFINSKLLGIPLSVFFLFLFVIVAQVLLNNTKFGRSVFAVGINEEAARVCSIHAKNVQLLVYIIAAFFSGVAGILLTARLSSASAVMGSDVALMDAIGGAVIGGASVYGGIGSVLGALFGALFITIIGNAMNLLSVTYYTMLIIKGAIIILFTYFDSIRAKS